MPQHANKMTKVLMGISRDITQSNSAPRGVILMGDALHSFPPDLGQGVNSGLEDVVELDRALTTANNSIPHALKLLEEERMPEV